MRPASSLYKFTRYGAISGDPRADYRAVHGTDAAPFDASQPAKLWDDPSAPDDPNQVVQYKRLPTRGSSEGMALQPFALPGNRAHNVNLPGLPHYPPYDPGRSFSVTSLPGQQPQLLSPELLSTPAQATALNSLLGGDGISYDVEGIDGASINYGTDPRRVWVVRRQGAKLIVGLLLKAQATTGLTSTAGTAGKNVASGVGSPGHFDLTKADPPWIPDLIDLGAISNNLPELPVPCNDLTNGDTLVVAGLEQTLFVQSAAEAAGGTGGTGSGGVSGLPDHFAPDWTELVAGRKLDSAVLNQIFAGLKAAGLIR